MSSPGSTRDLLKAIQIFTVSPKLPLPDDLSRTIDAYLDKHSENDQATSDRLQESLQATFAQSLHSQHPICYASFLAVLRQLRPAIRSTAHIMQWWEKLVEPLFDQLGDERTPSAAVISDIGEFLFPDEEDDDGEESWASIQETSKDAAPYGLGLRLLQKWMVVYQGVLKKGCSLGWTRERPIQDTLMLLGKRKPKAFFLAVNDFFIQKDYRTRAISLLSEFIRSQPPHLYLIVKSPLFDSLLRCLQIDTSTTVISLALTCLTMLLPNMPGTIVPYLAALFNIYARILFWDREQPNADDLEKPISSLVEQSSALRTWEKCTFLTDIDGIAIPHLLGYFNILYGLYPLNFMDYIRKPQRYLRHANAQDTDEVEIQPSEMRDRSEKYRQCHMLHPNFFSLTIDSEKTDFGRWIRSAAADVVAECVSLQISVDEMHPSQVDSITQRHLLRAEVPIFLQGSSTVSASVTTAAETAQNQTIPEGAQLSALTGPASLSSSSQHPLAVLRRTSEASQPCDLVRRDSTNISHTDSPTLGPMLSQNNYNADVLSVSTAVSDYSADGKPGLYQAPANNSVPSLALSHQDSIPEQIRSPSRTSWHLPSLSAPSPLHLLDSIDDRAEDEPDKNGEDGDEYVPGKNVGPITEEMMVKMLRQILLMKSDLNFERYMVQQHLSHIGALRRSNIRQAVTEAETQRLILANRTLKQRLEDAKKSEAQVKKEAEMSRNMSKNWGDLLSNKLKKLHTEHKTWTAEKEGLERDLQTAKEESEHLLVLVCKAEVRELKAKQDMQMLEGAAAEMEKLKEKVKTLEAAKRESQKLDTQLEQSQERSAKLENALEMLQMKLEAREDEFSRTRLYYQQQILSLNSRVSEALHGGPMGGESPIIPDKVQAQVVNALAASRAKYIELQKSHVRLTRRFNKLLESTWHEQTVYTANDGLDAHHMSTLSDADMEAAGVFRTSPIAMRGSSATSSNAGGSVGHRRRQRGVSDAASHETVSPTSRTVPMSVSLGSAVSSPGSTSPQAERYHNRATSGFTNPLRQDRKDSKKPEESRDKRDRTSSGSGIRGMRGFA